MAKVTAEQEKVIRREDSLDNVYFQCLEIMRMPDKWSIDKDGNIIIVYPHPIVSREAYRVEGINYLPHKSYYLPDVLLERHLYWDEILTPKQKGRPKKVRVTKTMNLKNVKPVKILAPKPKKDKGVKPLGRPTKYTINDAMAWFEKRKQGLTYRDISELTGVPDSTISHYIKKYFQEAM